MGLWDSLTSDDSSKAMERRAKTAQSPQDSKPSPSPQQAYQGSIEQNPDTQKLRQQGQKSFRQAFGGSD